jgi:hypothetical protein
MRLHIILEFFYFFYQENGRKCGCKTWPDTRISERGKIFVTGPTEQGKFLFQFLLLSDENMGNPKMP